MSDGGKGHTQRPIEDKKKFDDNWERIFGKPEKVKEKDNVDKDKRV